MTIALAAGIATAKVAAAVAFAGALLSLGLAYRLVRRRLEAERAEAILEAEFQRLAASGEMQPQQPSVFSGSIQYGQPYSSCPMRQAGLGQGMPSQTAPQEAPALRDPPYSMQQLGPGEIGQQSEASVGSRRSPGASRSRASFPPSSRTS